MNAEGKLAIAAMMTVYVGKRAVQLGLKPDALLTDPAWHTLFDEAAAVVNCNVWWANIAAGVWEGPNEPLTPKAVAVPPVTPATATTGPSGTIAGTLQSVLTNGVLAAAKSVAGV